VWAFCLVFINITFCNANYVRENYTKKEVYIQMRDGKKLFTTIYTPIDTTKKYPIMLCRTPYSLYTYGDGIFPSKIGPSEYMMKDNYIFVYQNARGTYLSEGTYYQMTPHIADKTEVTHVDQSSDTYDSIEWLLKNIGCHNDKVGLWGISYRGFYAAASVIDAHPAIACSSPQAPITDWFIGDDVHHNGAFALLPAFVFFELSHDTVKPPYMQLPKRFPIPVNDAYNFFLKYRSAAIIEKEIFKGRIPYWDTLMQHPNYDQYWKSRNIRPHLHEVKPAVMVVGGWFDNENIFGSLQTYKSLAKNKSNNVSVVLGPWTHGGWARTTGESMGILDFGTSTSDFYQREIELPFFKHYLKGTKLEDTAEAYAFETGTNVWRKYDHWPPYKTWVDTMYLNNSFGITKSKPVESGFKFDKYISDPNNPVPYTSLFHQARLFYNKAFINEDQRFAASRPDVLVYNTSVLEDTLTIAGPITVELFVVPNCQDADFVVKIIDCYPDTIRTEQWVRNATTENAGYQMMVRGEIMRGKYRNDMSKPGPFLPGKAVKVRIDLNDINHAFLPGHKLQIQIQSSWFPLYDMNPQKFMNIYQAQLDDYQKAEIRILRSLDYPSRIIFNKTRFEK
ncbi:MAG: CocE/NonD family hydrolase, partial [Bacteroidales bacterium]|nr:CocE/NonD family hydrolase [Bacteroidales bacterium]